MNNNLKYVKKQVGIVLAVLLFGLILFALGLVVGYGGKNPWDIYLQTSGRRLLANLQDDSIY